MELLGIVAVAAVVYFGGAYLGYWHAPFVNPKNPDGE
jgi:hypothetical protein